MYPRSDVTPKNEKSTCSRWNGGSLVTSTIFPRGILVAFVRLQIAQEQLKSFKEERSGKSVRDLVWIIFIIVDFEVCWRSKCKTIYD